MNANNQYLLLFSGPAWYEQLSPAQIQIVIEQSKAWFEALASAGKAKIGQALAREGATVSGKNARVICDGPFAESKEAIGGFLIIQAESLDEAIAIAKENPALQYGSTIDVRPLSDECPLTVRARQLGLSCEVQMTASAAA